MTKWLKHPDLVLLSLLSLVAVLAVALNVPSVIRLVLALPLVLFAPGYVLHAALLPNKPLPPLERTLVAIAGSVVVTILLGLLLAGLRVPIGPASWTVALAAFTVLGSALAWYRIGERDELPDELPSIRARDAVPIMVALIGVIAIIVGTRVIAAQNEAPVAEQLWLLPSDDSLDAHLGMRASDSGGSYVIRLTSAGELLEEYELDLEPAEIWQQDVAFDEEDRVQPIVGRLYVEGSDEELRFVVLQPPPP